MKTKIEKSVLWSRRVSTYCYRIRKHVMELCRATQSAAKITRRFQWNENRFTFEVDFFCKMKLYDVQKQSNGTMRAAFSGFRNVWMIFKRIFRKKCGLLHQLMVEQQAKSKWSATMLNVNLIVTILEFSFFFLHFKQGRKRRTHVAHHVDPSVCLFNSFFFVWKLT